MKDTDDMSEYFNNLDIDIKLCKDCKHCHIFGGEDNPNVMDILCLRPIRKSVYD